MYPSQLDTIVALATPPGLGGVAIVRLSGMEALPIAQALSGRQHPWEPRHLYYSPIRDAQGQILDRALVVYMAAPHSYTGEEVAEIHCHGGMVVAQLVIDLCLERGARLATPGEFTYRAYLAGKIDLAEAESILSLIEARSKGAVYLAAQNLGGGLARQLGGLKDSILEIVAQLEAQLDYGEELESLDPLWLKERVTLLGREIASLWQEAEEGRLVVEGLETVLVGPPNAGKSTLWNKLLGQERALVTPYAGTTRDQLQEYLYLEGLALHLIDTAGLRESSDPVESLGIAKTREALARASLVLVVLDGSQELSSDMSELLSDLSQKPQLKLLVVLNKRDCGVLLSPSDLQERFGLTHVCQTALKWDQGLEGVKRAIVELGRSGREVSDGALSLSQRQRQALLGVRQAWDSLVKGVQAEAPWDCLLLDLHQALRSLNELTGQDVSNEILERVFSKFCLGK